MKRDVRMLAAAGVLLLMCGGTASAQKQGGILRIGHFDSLSGRLLVGFLLGSRFFLL